MILLPPSRSRAVGLVLAALAALLSTLALADPPSRVARLALTEGAVSFSPAGDNDWVRASPNRPLVTGDRLWADADARAEVQLAGATLWLGATTNVALVNLDDRIAQFQITQGTLQLRVRGLANGEQIEIDTPNFAFVPTRPGLYRFDVDADGASTRLYVRSGEGDVYGDGAAYHLASGQAVRFRGTDLGDSDALGLAPPDPFERWAQTRDGRHERLAAARYVAPDVIGYEDLDQYGTWSVVANVGNVWMPSSVPAGWAPYRTGHWAWIDPWGWTWVDDAPWGFAPFHYGRWALVDDRWGWVPGPVRQRPVYAPALVAFIGGANFSVTASSGPAIGWFPLGPGEVYRPAYTVSREYFTRINVTNTVVNTTYVTNIYENRDRVTDVRYANFARPAAITAVPPAVFAQAQPVQRAAMTVNRQVLDKAEIIPLAKVTPQRESVTGAAPAARAAPPSHEKPVVAKAPPPPAPLTLEAKLPALRAAPGKPLDRPTADATPPRTSSQPAPAQATPLPATRVVKAAEPKPLPARGVGNASRGGEPGKDKGQPPPESAQRTATPPGAASPGQPPPPATTATPTAPPLKESPGKGRPPQADTRDTAKGSPPPSEPRESGKGVPQSNEARENVKGPEPRDSKGQQPNETPRGKGPPSREERTAPPSPQAPEQPPARAQPNVPMTPPPSPSSGLPPSRDRATAPPPPAPPAQRAPEPRGNGGPPQRSTDMPPRTNEPPRAKGPPSPPPSAQPENAPRSPAAAPPAAPPPQAAPRTPPPPAPAAPPPQAAPRTPPPPAAVAPSPPQAAPRAPPPSAAPAPSPPQAAPKGPPSAQDNEARGKGKGNENRRKEDDDQKK